MFQKANILIKMNRCFRNQNSNDTKNKIYLTEHTLYLTGIKDGSQFEQHTGSKPWKEVIAHKRKKIYPNGNVKLWSHRVPTQLHLICPQDFPHLLSSEQDASDRSLSEIIQVIMSTNDHAGRSCSFQSLFCLDRPFGFSVHRDTLFCQSRLFRFSTCRVYIFSFYP